MLMSGSSIPTQHKCARRTWRILSSDMFWLCCISARQVTTGWRAMPKRVQFSLLVHRTRLGFLVKRMHVSGIELPVTEMVM